MISSGFANILAENLLSPMVLFFVLGLACGFLKSELEIPEQISKFLSIYLIVAIGFKGGVALADTHLNMTILWTIIAGIVLGFSIPIFGYKILRIFTNLSTENAAAVAAHYGSISIVTFMAATSFLKNRDIDYDGFLVGILAIMEVPAIVAALTIVSFKKRARIRNYAKQISELFSNSTVILLIGSLLIGYTVGENGADKLRGFMVEPFYGFLSLFLLDMGLNVSRRSESFNQVQMRLVMFAIFMPIFCSIIGVLTAKFIGLSFGSAVLFATLMASSSYIAVPATMKIALPHASPQIYMSMSLGITFPFNIILGLPLYFYFTELALK